MTTLTPCTTAARLARIAAVTCFAASATFGISALARPPVAHADWDIEAYDNCISRGYDAERCCYASGGVWHSNEWKCGAPTAPTANQNGPGTPTQEPVRPVIAPPPNAGNLP